MQVLDRVLTSYSFETLYYLSLIAIISLVFSGILNKIRSIILIEISNQIEIKFLGILFNLSFEKKDDYCHIHKNIKDLNIVKDFIGSHNLTIIFDIPFGIIYLLIIFLIHWINGLTTVLGAIILIIIAYFKEKSNNKIISQLNKIQSELNYDLEKINQNSNSIIAMAIIKNLSKNWQEKNFKLIEKSNIYQYCNVNFSNLVKSFRMILQVVIIGISAILVMKNQMSAGGIIACSILVSKALQPLDNITNLWQSIKNFLNSFYNLNNLLQNNSLTKNKISLNDIGSEIIVDKLIYKPHNSNKIILKGLSFKINHAEIFGIMGDCASSKSILAKIIIGIIKPSSGNVLINSADLFDQDIEELGKNFGYVSQNNELFHGSIKENISRMSQDFDDQKIIEIAKLCNIHEMILGLENGYETMIGKDYNNISQGQIQAIAIARAFYGNIKLIIFDEPFNNLDLKLQNNFKKIINYANINKITIIIISNQLNLLNLCDRIMILHKGEIKEIISQKTN
jgi:PrtD family type I secretion system ABC transporter